MTIGLIVNPAAGLGGEAGLKGSDGARIQARARALGIPARAGLRAQRALEVLRSGARDFALLTAPGEMGEEAARACGFSPVVIGSIAHGRTTAEDTVRIARAMADAGAQLIAFAGGDGTARAMYEAVGTRVPVLGIPAGVKIHSAVYAVNPRAAGEALACFLSGGGFTLDEAEVMDIDEEDFRRGRVSARLYGSLLTARVRGLMQGTKTGYYSERESLSAIAADVVEHMDPEAVYLIGPGTTTRSVLERLGLPCTLLGVDAVRGGTLIGQDLNEREIASLIRNRPAHIVVTAIGGQGHIFGRGNQQLSPRVLRAAGRENIHVIATRAKLVALGGAPFLLDTGDDALDRELAGYYRVVVGYEEYIPYRAAW